MPKALILVADGSEEIEFVTPYDVLTRAGFEVTSVGVQLKENYAHMTRNIRIVPDIPNVEALAITGDNPSHKAYDILILPGGGPGAKTFSTSESVLGLINAFTNAEKYVAAICAGTTALVAAHQRYGGKKAIVTSHPSVREVIETENGWEYSEERVVIDGNIITSRGPGTAMLFALTIVEEVCGKEKRDEVAGPMIVAEKL